MTEQRRTVIRALSLLMRCALAVLGYVSASNAAQMWEVTAARLAMSGPTVTLRVNDKIVATLATSQLKKLHDAKEKIGSVAGLPYVVLAISDQDEPNAFAGSHEGRRVIAFTLGMLRFLGEDENMMAAVMGHEFGHHVRGHDGRATRRTAVEIVGFLAAVIAGRSIADRFAADLAARAIDLAGRAVIHSYDRDQEREADTSGIEVMALAGYDPYGAVRYWNNAGNRDSGGIFTTHPTTAERLQNLQELAQLHTATVRARYSAGAPTVEHSIAAVAKPKPASAGDTDNARAASKAKVLASAPAAAQSLAPVLALEVGKGDTLFAIARKHRHLGVTLNQMTLAIYGANKHAFVQDSLELRSGTTILIPSRELVLLVNSEEAARTIMEKEKANRIEAIFACLAPGLPEKWKRAWVVLRDQSGAAGQESIHDAKFLYVIALNDATGEAFTPCNATIVADRLYNINKYLPLEKRNWREARLVFTYEGHFELKYEY